MPAKKSISKKRPTKGQDIYGEIRHLGVIIEHVDDKVTLVAEQYGDIRKDINALAVDTKKVQKDIAIMKIDIEIMKADIEFIKHGLKKKVDIDEFAVLQRRVTLLERKR